MSKLTIVDLHQEEEISSSRMGKVAGGEGAEETGELPNVGSVVELGAESSKQLIVGMDPISAILACFLPK